MRDQESEPHSVELNATTPGTNCGVVVDDDLGAKVGTGVGWGGGGEFRKEVYTGSDKGGGGLLRVLYTSYKIFWHLRGFRSRLHLGFL